MGRGPLGCVPRYFADAHLSDADVASFIPTLKICANLKYLKLRGNLIDDDGLRRISDAIADGYVPRLKVRRTNRRRASDPSGRPALALLLISLP